jgi:threonylcarbamoyladenosine tRNA methylthiotransferase MtaB
MRRRYKRKIFEERVRMIRKALPFAGIGADIIVGFPGESGADFEDTLSFVKDLPLSYLHVFTFSERPGTIAETLPGKVQSSEKVNRSKILIDLSEKKTLEFNNMNLGQITDVLFEKTKIEGLITGFSSNYIRVEHPWQARLAGQVKKVRLIGITPSGRMSIELIDR